MFYQELAPNWYKLTSSNPGEKLIMFCDEFIAFTAGFLTVPGEVEFPWPRAPFSSIIVPEWSNFEFTKIGPKPDKKPKVFKNMGREILIAEKSLYLKAGIIVPNK